MNSTKYNIISIVVWGVSILLNLVYFYSSDIHFSGSFSVIFLGVTVAHICFMYYWEDGFENSGGQIAEIGVINFRSLRILGPAWLINAGFLLVSVPFSKFMYFQLFLLPSFYLLCISSLTLHFLMRRRRKTILFNKFLMLIFISIPALRFFIFPLLYKDKNTKFDFNVNIIDSYIESHTNFFIILVIVFLLIVFLHWMNFVIRRKYPNKLLKVFE